MAQFTCERCKIEFVPKSHGKNYKFCSHSCAMKGNKINEGRIAWNRGRPNTWSNGEKSNLWKGGVAEINHKIRSSLENRIWRTAVFMRDDYTCQKCGKRGNTTLHADHIKPFALYPELRFAIDNGRTLCKSCHMKTETYGWRIKYFQKGVN